MAKKSTISRERSLVYSVSVALTASTSTVKGLDKAAELLAKHTNAQAVQISAITADGERVFEIYSRGNLKSMFPSGLKRPSHGSSMRIVSKRGTLLFGKKELLQGASHGVEDFAVFTAAGHNHLAAASVRLHGVNLGAVQLLSPKPLSDDVTDVLELTVSLLAPYFALFLTQIESANEDRISMSIERVAEAVIQENGLKGVCDAVVSFAKNSMGIDAAILRVNNSASGELRIEYKHGHLDPVEVAGKSFWMVEDRLIPAVVKGGGPMIVDEDSPNVLEDQELNPLLEELPSMLITPLFDKGELLGTLEFYSLNEYAYKADHLRNVEHVANLLTSAVEHFRLIRSLSREAEIRSLLAEVARLASAAHELTSLVESISPDLRRVIPAERVTYFMPAELFHSLTPPSVDTHTESDDASSEQAAGQAEPVVSTDELVRIVDANSGTSVCHGQAKKTRSKAACGAAHCLSAKLWEDADDRPQGWIHLERSDAPFTIEEKGLLPEFARHISPAIDTALSHESELRLAQEQLRAERAEAEVVTQQRLNEAKENFIATMSHELRTPLTSIRAFVDILSRGNGNLGDRQIKQLSVVRRNTEWLNILINDLLDLSSIDSGRFELQLQEQEIGSLLNGLMESFGPIVKTAGHEMRAILPKHELKMMVDPNRVSQVVGNMLTNAVKYSPEGTLIRLMARPANGGVSIYVRDEGPGIPVREKAKVFDRFVRAKSKATKRAHGNGIGLYVSKMIVESHGGRIGVTSKLDSHTTMYFWLPCEQSKVRNGSEKGSSEDAA